MRIVDGVKQTGGRTRFAQCKVGIPPRRSWRCTEMDALLGSLSCGHHAQLGQRRDSGRRCEASQLTLSAALGGSDPEPPRAAASTLRKVGSRPANAAPLHEPVSNDELGLVRCSVAEGCCLRRLPQPSGPLVQPMPPQDLPDLGWPHRVRSAGANVWLHASGSGQRCLVGILQLPLETITAVLSRCATSAPRPCHRPRSMRPA
ncbi:hypothetical protein I8G32_02867 [Rhodopseudomonas palustris]|nr:hypothetical protein I8G32_02867 [Rhodopseudomonas palustris]